MHIRLFMFLLSWCGEPRSIRSVHRDHLSFFNSEDEGNRQATNARELSFSVSGIESGRTWKSPHSIPKLSPYPQMHSSATKVKTRKLPPCHNSLATALLVDTYQITMAYAYWKNGTHARIAAFDLLFRKNPFNGEFTVFAGLEECLRFISNFRFTGADIAFLRR